MKRQQYNQGIAPLIIVLIIAIILGGGIYIAKHAPKSNSGENAQPQASTNAGANADVNANANANVSTSGSLRSLFAIGRNVMCTVNGEQGSGTVYISADGSMRGDMTSTSSSGVEVNSHMIKQGDTMYVWSGTRGAKMSTSMLNANASAQARAQVDLDKKVDYKCSDWTVDATKFETPSTVSFVDINAMLQGSVKLPVKTSY